MNKKTLNRIAAGEKGQALIIVVLLMLVGALVIAPMLSQVGSGLKSGKDVYEERMGLFYSADSGVEDGLWQIKSENIVTLFTDFDPYEYGEIYEYPDSLDINGNEVDVSIENVWVPKDIDAPSTAAQAIAIIEGRLVITGSMPDTSTYQIKIIYNYDNDEDPGGADLEVNTIGIWLPPGFDYEGECNLASDDDTSGYATPVVEDYCSGKAVLWDFPAVPLVDFPGGAGYPMERNITFQFSGPENENPGTALSWVDTSGVSGIDYTWDADVKVYKITSTAKDDRLDKQTTVEAYTAVCKLRPQGDAVSGDYVAIGNTLLTSNGSPYYPQYRNRLYRESSATIQSDDPQAPGYIPENAHLDAALLYWSGWIEEAEAEVIWGPEDCANFTAPVMDWSAGSRWTIDNSGSTPPRFRGRGGSYTTAQKTITMNTSIDLSAYSGETINISWEQWKSGSLSSGEGLYYAFYNGSWSTDFVAFQGNSTPTSPLIVEIPEAYLTSNFKMRFSFNFNNTNEYVYIDNIRIFVVQPPVETAKVNRVIFNGHQITANLEDCQTASTSDSGAPDSWSYSCFYDATDLVAQLIEDEVLGPEGAGTYTLGHWMEDGEEEYNLYPSGTTGYPLATPALSTAIQYMYTYAGWSLILMYSSPETEGHQLWLFDDFHYIKPHTEGLKFSIGGFLVPDPIGGEITAAHMTCFVGDGDLFWPGDFLALNAPSGLDGDEIPNSYKLWDGTETDGNSQSDPNNAWNSTSVGLTFSGIDIDTFNVPWGGELLEPGDTSAEVVLNYNLENPSGAELINFVYIILSFRSSITSGGTISYLVRG